MSLPTRTAFFAAWSMFLASASPAQFTTLESVSSSNLQQDNGDAFLFNSTAVSDSGRCIAFYNLSQNLVAGGTPGVGDILLRDRRTRETLRASVNALGVPANNFCFDPAISGDGHFVAYSSTADNLVAGDTNLRSDVFVWNRAVGSVERVSISTSGRQGTEPSSHPSLSAEGRYVAFLSRARQFGGQFFNINHVYVRDRTLGTTELVSVSTALEPSDRDCNTPRISADGNSVVFWGFASNLVAAPNNLADDVYLHDRTLGTTELISQSSGGVRGSLDSRYPAVSGDGQRVVFQSVQSFDPLDSNGKWDIYLRDRTLNTTTLISRTSSGNAGDGDSTFPDISRDGDVITFESSATDLVTADGNDATDIFQYTVSTGVMARVSVNDSGIEGLDASRAAALSGDGRLVAFYSKAHNLVPGDQNGEADLFMHGALLSAEASPQPALPAAPLSLDAWGGVPNSPAVFALEAVNGMPLFLVAGMGLFDAVGHAALGSVVPAAASGATFEIVIYGARFGSLQSVGLTVVVQ